MVGSEPARRGQSRQGAKVFIVAIGDALFGQPGDHTPQETAMHADAVGKSGLAGWILDTWRSQFGLTAAAAIQIGCVSGVTHKQSAPVCSRRFSAVRSFIVHLP